MWPSIIPTNLANGFLAAASPSGEGGGGVLGSLMPMILILGRFYFILIMPMRRRQKKQQEMIGSLKRGDKVLPTGGVFGTVMGISDRLIQLKIADQVTIEISRSAVASLQSPDSGEKRS
jgi:preprotein translocase subunit YajC